MGIVPGEAAPAAAGMSGKLGITGDELRMLLPADCPPELKSAIRRHKPALLELLRLNFLGRPLGHAQNNCYLDTGRGDRD